MQIGLSITLPSQALLVTNSLAVLFLASDNYALSKCRAILLDIPPPRQNKHPGVLLETLAKEDFPSAVFFQGTLKWGSIATFHQSFVVAIF